MTLSVTDLLDRPVYGFAQVDRVLGLAPGTAARWIDGYERGGKSYEPVVREKSTGVELVTWGEFVEVRLLSEYREARVPMIRLRPSVQRLREEMQTAYPLARARAWLEVEGREVVRRAQGDVGSQLSFTVVRTGQEQIVLDRRSESFVESVTWDRQQDLALKLQPLRAVPDVVCDPLRQVGEPTVNGIMVDVIAEQVRVGEPLHAIAEVYGLTPALVESAVRYVLLRTDRQSTLAAA